MRAARSVAWVPGGTAGEVVHALKYDGWSRVAIEMAERLARLHWPVDVVEERAALIPVPLGGGRMRERGYNQSERIAAALAPLWKVPVWGEVIERTRATVSQTELTPDARKRNVAGAFSVVVERQQQIRGAHLVIIDDVMTTAATLNACAAALYEAGARTISYVTFGRARAAGDHR
ncbi:MAG: ComF family protein [Gemmatimonadaceae bacterium]|nr:ComF family protein [Gemmatimonadaceae bacterium]